MARRWTDWCASLLVSMALLSGLASAGEDWLQMKYDARRSGDVPQRSLQLPLGLIGAVPLGDSVFTSPVVSGGRIYAVDGSGTAYCIDSASLRVLWKYDTAGGKANCNNVSSPALIDGYLHFGTMAGRYYVLDAESGKPVKEIACGEPIFSSPAISEGRVYFATLGAQVHAIKPNGELCWTWDFVQEVLKFPGDRWNGAEWRKFKDGRVTWRDQFCCSTDIAARGKTLVVPAGGRTVFLQDAGDRPQLQTVGLVPPLAGSEYPATFGQSIGEDGAVYRQWHRRDNYGRVEILTLDGSEVKTAFVPGTATGINMPGLLNFSSVSIRGQDVFRCRPESGYGLCRHSPSESEPQRMSGAASIASPILTKQHAVFGGLDGCLHIVPLDGSGSTAKPWSFKTALGRAISSPAAVCDGRVIFGGEDGYLYVLGRGGKASPPTQDLGLHNIRSPLTSNLPEADYDWFTNYGNLASTNANDQDVRLPVKIRWVRRYEGTFKHLPVCGGGRLYTHTSEGQIFAVEQETGRLLWRQYFPDVYLSFTSPIYFKERLLVPQAGLKQSMLRCFDAKTGAMLWETPFTGSPSWSRQGPPVLYKNLAIYSFGSGKYAPQGTEKAYVHKDKPVPSPDGAEVMSWIYTHDNPYYPKDNRPLIRAWDIETGREVWSRDFADLGAGGNDSGLCLLDGTLYYSTFFGYAAKRSGQPGPRGMTAALDPATGEVRWKTTEYSVTAGCTISGRDGRLYLGGYNRPDESTQARFVRCLDAKDGSLVWQSEPLASAVNVVSISDRHVFTNASGKDGYVLDRRTGKILSRFNYGYACTRFTLSEPYVFGCNLDMIDLDAGNALVTSGPAVDSRECVGSVVSNGRLFYTAQASGLQLSQSYGEEAEKLKTVWEQE